MEQASNSESHLPTSGVLELEAHAATLSSKCIIEHHLQAKHIHTKCIRSLNERPVQTCIVSSRYLIVHM